MKLRNKLLAIFALAAMVSCEKECYDCYQIGNYTHTAGQINQTWYGDTIEVCGEYSHEEKRATDEHGGETYVFWNCVKK